MSLMTPVKCLLVIPVLVGLTFMPCQAHPAEDQEKSPDDTELRLFHQVMHIVQKNYVRKVSGQELIQGAIDGMLQSLDRHSVFLSKGQSKELLVEAKQEFGGIGIEMTLVNGLLTIVSPIEDTPAYKAGLKAGDKIININGAPTKDITLIDAVKQMRGPKGSKVIITIMREGSSKLQNFTITRDIMHFNSVKKELIEPGYPYVKIVNFQDGTDTDLTATIDSFGDEDGIKGMVLDLRNNPGGLLDQAIKVSNLFIDKGLIAYTDGRVKDQRMEFRASANGKHYKFKTAVLINEGSAGASEIIAGALQEHDRALVFGTKSFGKTAVQTIIPLENGSALRLTTAYYYTPKGRHIQKRGIEPDMDLKEIIQEQQEQKERDISNKEPKVTKHNKIDLRIDPVLRAAVEWLKSDLTAKQCKTIIWQ